MDTKQDGRLSILMLPWLAHGHIYPFLELAKKLTKRNFHIYFCSTPVNLSSIKQQLSEESFPSLQLVELHLPALPDLPPHYHTTKGLPPHLGPTLKKALDMAEPTLCTILKLLNPNLLIYDFFQPWAPVVASAQNIPAILFNTTGAATFCFPIHYTKNPSVEFPFPFIHFEEHEMRRNTQLLNSSSSRDMHSQCIEKSCNIILMKTVREIEAKYLDYLSVIYEKKCVPVGVLVNDPIDENNQSEFIEWLSKKDQSSTVFVSFGSECFLTEDEMEEIAHGLELSGINFIWAVKFPKGEKSSGIDEVLPQGFVERVGDRGMVVEGWAPQTQILQHSSIGGFVSHCGWSSVVEGMRYGIPIIAMPIHLDQPLNARMVVENGVGVEVKRDKDGRVERGEVAKVIREVIVEKEGENVRREAKEMGEKIGKKGEEEIDELVEELMILCKN